MSNIISILQKEMVFSFLLMGCLLWELALIEILWSLHLKNSSMYLLILIREIECDLFM